MPCDFIRLVYLKAAITGFFCLQTVSSRLLPVSMDWNLTLPYHVCHYSTLLPVLQLFCLPAPYHYSTLFTLPSHCGFRHSILLCMDSHWVLYFGQLFLFVFVFGFLVSLRQGQWTDNSFSPLPVHAILLLSSLTTFLSLPPPHTWLEGTG